VDEGLRLTRGLGQGHRAQHVGLEDALRVLLPGVGAMGGEVEDPLGPRGRASSGDGLAVAQVALQLAHIACHAR
jgi:hypothetical protein